MYIYKSQFIKYQLVDNNNKKFEENMQLIYPTCKYYCVHKWKAYIYNQLEVNNITVKP